MNLLTDELRKGRIMAIVIDQRGKRENRLFCNVFGKPAPTSPAPALIALRGDALVIPVSAVKRGEKYIFRFDELIDSRHFGDDHKQIEHLRDGRRSAAVRERSRCTPCLIFSSSCSILHRIN